MTAKSAKTKTSGESGVHPAAKPFLWLDKPLARDVITLSIIGLAMILFAVDFFVHRHDYLPLAERSGFYALFGFVSFAFAVLAGWPLRALLMKKPDYYGESDDDDA